MSTAVTPSINMREPRRRPAPQLTVLAALGVLLLAFAPTLISFPPAWLNQGGQGFVVAAFVGYLLWRDREKLLDFRAAVPEVSLVVAGLSVLWLTAYVLNVQTVHQAALPLVLLSWLLAVGGACPALAALPIVAVFFLAVPVWGVLIGVLQSMTIFVNGLLLDVAGIEAVIRGENIQIPAGVFWVAQGCAGLNYFETSLLISVIYSLLFLTQWRYRFVSIAVATALAIVSNWLRVFGLIVIGHTSNMQSSLIKEHALYGWLIFAVAMLIFFAVTRPIENRDQRAEQAKKAKADSLTSAEQIRHRNTQSGRHTPALKSVALPTFAAVLGPALFLLLGGRSTAGTEPADAPGIQAERTGENTTVLTATTNGLLATNVSNDSIKALQPWSPQYAGADKHRIEEYSVAGAAVRLDRLIYTQQGQGKELISGLNIIAEQENRFSQQTVGPLDATGRMMNTTIVRTPEGARLVWHWFSVGGAVTHSTTRAKLMELIAFVRSSSPPAELVTVSTLCEPDNCTAANKTLYEFVIGQPLPGQ